MHANDENPSATQPIIELRNCSRGFGTTQVLRNINLNVYAGETLVLIGESGCGKSVTTKLLANLLEPSSGEVLWNGQSVAARSDRQLRQDRLKLGYLFQGGAMFDSLSVFENVVFGLRENHAMSEAEMHDIAMTRLREVGLPAAAATKYPSELSGGMRKRAALARALAMSPDIIVYDEPTTGLDPIMSDVINELILQTRSSRPVTSIVVTHDMTTVKRVATRVAMLFPLARLAPHESQVIFEGTAEEAFEHPDERVHDFVHGISGKRLQELFAA
ncbi:MAG: ABC transporter ATP-binding protein [Planctomyces sp.]|nr:ABC transporter ATP-binding protein [Planctomyces sp.]